MNKRIVLITAIIVFITLCMNDTVFASCIVESEGTVLVCKNLVEDQDGKKYRMADELCLDTDNQLGEIRDDVKTDRIFTRAVSQESYYQYILEWSYSENVINDMLVSVNTNGMNINFTYDENGYRKSKTVNGETVFYEYTEWGYLKKEITSDYTVEYCYDYNYDICGFIYMGEFYKLRYDDGKVSDILLNDLLVAHYEYDESMSLKYTEKYNRSAVGDINNIIGKGKYYDRETGWYYSGRYYDPVHDRCVDGLSDFELEEYINQYGYTREILYHIRDIKTIEEIGDEGSDIPLFLSGHFPNATTEQAGNIITVAKVIKGEAGAFVYDAVGIATVIQNRMKDSNKDFGGPTAIGVVSNPGHFYAYDIINTISLDLDSTAVREQLVIGLAEELVMNKPLTKSVSGVTTQLFFCSLKSAMYGSAYASPITEKNGKLWRDGKQVTDVRTYFTGTTPVTREIIENLYVEFGAGNAFSVYYNWDY